MTALTEPPRPADVRTADQQLAQWRSKLLAELAAEVEKRDQHQATIDELTGQGDVDSILERGLAESAVERANDTAASIQRAIDRIASGDFGRCSRCGGPIGTDRLEAIPHAERCIDCPPSTSWLGP